MMKGMTRLAMGVTLTVTLSLALLLTFLLFLLADLFCSLLLRNKRGHGFRRDNAADEEAREQQQPEPGPLSLPFYAHGVLQVSAPASSKFLLSIPNLKAATAMAAAKESCPLSPLGAQRGGSITDSFVYISNPIYGGSSRAAVANGAEEEEEEEEDIEGWSPPLKVMKKLPPVMMRKANSSVYEGRPSLAASTETNYRPSSSSLSSSLSSNSLCSSPAW